MNGVIDGKTIEAINNWYECEERHQKAETELRQQRTYDLTSDGIDPEIAKLMVEFDLDLW